MSESQPMSTKAKIIAGIIIVAATMLVIWLFLKGPEFTG